MNRWDSEPLWMFFEEPATVTRPEPEVVAAEPSSWDIEKSVNRLAKKLRQIDAGRLVPRLVYQLTGEAEKEVQEVRDLLSEAGQELKGT